MGENFQISTPLWHKTQSQFHGKSNIFFVKSTFSVLFSKDVTRSRRWFDGKILRATRFIVHFYIIGSNFLGLQYDLVTYLLVNALTSRNFWWEKISVISALITECSTICLFRWLDSFMIKNLISREIFLQKSQTRYTMSLHEINWIMIIRPLKNCNVN